MKQCSHTLTEHARERIAERSTAGEAAVISLLDEGLFVPLGTEGSGKRSHELLYLAEDRHWFVVVRDSRTLEVITMLPVDYHENLAWKVSYDAMQLARQLVEPAAPVVAEEAAAPAAGSYKVTVAHEAGFNCTKRRKLFSWPADGIPAVGALFDDPAFRDEVVARIEELGIPFGEVICLVIWKKKREEEVFFPIDPFLKEFRPYADCSFG